MTEVSVDPAVTSGLDAKHDDKNTYAEQTNTKTAAEGQTNGSCPSELYLTLISDEHCNRCQARIENSSQQMETKLLFSGPYFLELYDDFASLLD
ncbi:Adenylosuccinate synthetase [Trichinella spiralis]|uniref:Adenylosuccinate synthetase n=1 Tax=Trichinella spiralis TaxID=6334 RepID=A0ABR3KF16_TRISP